MIRSLPERGRRPFAISHVCDSERRIRFRYLLETNSVASVRAFQNCKRAVDAERYILEAEHVGAAQNRDGLLEVRGFPTLDAAVRDVDPPGDRDAAVAHVRAHLSARIAFAVADLDHQPGIPAVRVRLRVIVGTEVQHRDVGLRRPRRVDFKRVLDADLKARRIEGAW
jgi:hypothetical protein